MSYNKEDLKRTGLRIARNINHDLQRSKMNPYLKPYFTESSVQFVDNENFVGIALNVVPLDMQDSLDEMEEVRFVNNMKLLKETVERYLKKEKLEDVFELKSYSENPTLMEFDGTYTDQYKNFALGIKKENIDIVAQHDMIDDKVKTLVPGFTVNSYEISPDNQGNATTKDLRGELIANDPLKVLADPVKGKLAINSSHYNDMVIDHGFQKDIER